MNKVWKFVVAAGLFALSCMVQAPAQAQLLVDPSGGTVLATSGDDISVGPRSLGFTGTYFCTDQTSIFVNSNGNLTFGSGSSTFTNSPLPSGTPARISALWDDLFMPPGQIIEKTNPGVYYSATWNGVGNFSTSDNYTFQAVLFGSATTVGGINFQVGDIAFSYADVGPTYQGNTATVGLNAGNGVDFAPLPGTTNGIVNNNTTLLPIYGNAGEVVLFRPFGSSPEDCGYNVSIVGPGAAVPEPGAVAMLIAPLVAAGLIARRRCK